MIGYSIAILFWNIIWVFMYGPKFYLGLYWPKNKDMWYLAIPIWLFTSSGFVTFYFALK
jgi:hypothetical protein